MVVDNIVFCLGTRFGSKTGVWAQAEQFLSSSFLFFFLRGGEVNEKGNENR